MTHSSISHYSDVTGQVTFSFDQLTDGSKAIARASALQVEVNALTRDLILYKNKPLHSKVNSQELASLVARKTRMNGLLSNPTKYDAVILSNMCVFLSDGTYVVHSLTEYKK